MIDRKLVSGLVLSASALVTFAVSEFYTSKAIIPTKGDRPTLGFGSTFHEDGRAVKMGDTTNPVNALIKMQAHITKEEVSFRKSLPNVVLDQREYDFYMDFTYQYGTANWWKSTMRTKLLVGDYKGSCDALLAYRFAAKYDCSTLVDGQPNKRCYGVWTRQLERHTKCMELLNEK